MVQNVAQVDDRSDAVLRRGLCHVATFRRERDLLARHEQWPAEPSFVGSSEPRGRRGERGVDPAEIQPSARPHRYGDRAHPVGDRGDDGRPQGHGPEQRHDVAVTHRPQRCIGKSVHPFRGHPAHLLEVDHGGRPPGVGLHAGGLQQSFRNGEHAVGVARVEADETEAQIERVTEHAPAHPVEAGVHRRLHAGAVRPGPLGQVLERPVGQPPAQLQPAGQAIAPVVGLRLDPAEGATALGPGDLDDGGPRQHDAVDGRQHVDVVQHRNRECAPAQLRRFGPADHARTVPVASDHLMRQTGEFTAPSDQPDIAGFTGVSRPRPRRRSPWRSRR